MTTTIITTCKGRVRQLQLSLATWLSATPCPIVVIADGCPELSGRLRAGGFPRDIMWDERVAIFWTDAQVSDHFSKPRALNLGAQMAQTANLLFLDSDTLVNARFWDWYSRRVAPDALFIVPPSAEQRDLTGILGVTKTEFTAVGGADEGFIGWGSEDLDLRLRLYLARALRIVDIPSEMLTAIPHDDDLRTRYYAEEDKMVTHKKNLQRLVDNAERLTGESIWGLLERPAVQRLFGSGLGTEVFSRRHT